MNSPRELDSEPLPSVTDTATMILSIGMGLIGVLAIIAAVLGCRVQGQLLRPVPDAAFSPVAATCPPRGITLDGTVIRVIDGDTVVVQSSIEYHVRLLDCWAPESRTKDSAEKQRGLKSKARMQQLADGKTVRVHLPGHGNLSDTITLGRVLGRVWLLEGDRPESCDLSSIMVAENLATPAKEATP